MLEEGDKCPMCTYGIMMVYPAEGCACHLGHPPCAVCVDNKPECSDCGYTEEEDEI